MSNIKVYSPSQGMAGTFLAGPLASTYFIAKNYLALGNQANYKKTVLFGVLASAVIISILPFLPDGFPGFAIPITNIIFTRFFIEQYQFTKQSVIEKGAYAFYSNWWVFGKTMVLLAIFMAVFIAYFMLLLGFEVNVG